MKVGVRTWIMIPVLLILLVLPIGTFGIFSLTSRWYVEQQARQRIERVADYISTNAEEDTDFSADGEKADGSEKSASEELIRRIGIRLKNRPLHVSVVAFDSEFRKTYSSTMALRTKLSAQETEWQQLLKTGGLISGVIQNELVDGSPYLVELCEVPSENSIPGKYFVVYERIADVTELLQEAGGLLLCITAVLLLISAAAVWWIARRIVLPLQELCAYTAKVGDGTRELKQKEYPIWEIEQLRTSFLQMEERLEETQREKEHIFQGISHDLRTPLMSIMGYADGLQRGVMTDVSRASGIILEESRRMKRMVDEILTMSKLDSNSWSDQKVRLSMGDFLEEQTDILQGMAAKQAKHVILADAETDTQAGDLIEADPELMIRIFQNVVSNCIRYAQENVLVHMDCQDGWVRVFVEDDGPGITEDDLPHIFDRDYHGHNGRFGLGLAIAKAGMEHLSGTISAESKKPPQHGASFCLCMPLAEAAEERPCE